MSHIQSMKNTFSGMACFPMLLGHTQVHYMVSEGVQNPYLQPEDRTDFGGGGRSQSDQVSMKGMSMGS